MRAFAALRQVDFSRQSPVFSRLFSRITASENATRVRSVGVGRLQNSQVLKMC